MTSAAVTRLPNGGTVNVRTGVLRGAGPQGPMGPQGPAGAKGDKGDAGPPGSINALRSVYSSNSGVATSFDQWYPLSLTLDPTRNDLMVSTADPYAMQWKETGLYMLVAVVRFEQRTGTEAGGSSSNSRRLQIQDNLGNRPNEECQWAGAASPTEPTIGLLVAVIEPDPSKTYKLVAQSDDTAGITVSNRSVTIVRVGSGPQGVAGPSGPVGATGPQGPQGAPGNAGTGYTNYDGVIGGSNSAVAPTNTSTAPSTDQGLVLPAGAATPATPYWMSRMATSLEPLLVSRYASVTDRNNKRPNRSAGEVTFRTDAGVPELRETNGTDNTIARIISSTGGPPSGSGQAAPGVLWVQY